MNNLKNKIKNMNGITLIALVVTVIILIILAGVAIYLALGNNGILNKAEQAKNETTKQAATEKMNLKITNMQIETYGKEQRMPTLQEFSDGLCEDDEIQYVELQSKKVGSLSKIEVGEAESIFTKLKEYPYEFEINTSLQLASIDGIKVATVPTNDGDTIVSMTKTELDSYVENKINSILSNYFCTSIATTTSSASENKPCVIIENYSNGTEWYRVWSDGWIEQGGHSTSESTEVGKKTTFNKNFSNTNYNLTLTITPETIGSGVAYTRNIQCQSKTIDGFYVKGGWARSNNSRWSVIYI